MKALHGIVFLLAMSLCLVSCDNGSAKVDDKVPTTKTETKSPPAAESQNREQKVAAQNGENIKFENRGELAGGVTVEKTTANPADVVDDEGVDYSKIAQAVCSCGAQYIGKDEQSGDVLVSKGDEKYKEVVDCSLKKKEKITTNTVSRQKLVRAIKAQCSAIPGTLVMSLILAMEKN